ncbi:hypothetical protein GGX14DRAFT_437892 [Mycena pura]|uniref:Uncharacterized protein n=1 Tax=Mycena pura TaxID=153505 RepID=A0AAD6VMR4_9AGAR|nr:hypothetical protein GGX14DRAFT_437892 [Mycena pura]
MPSSFALLASSAESTVFLKLSQSISSTLGGGNPFRPPPETFQQPTPFSTTHFQLSTSSLSATTSPQISTEASGSKNNALPLGPVVGASVVGTIIAALIVTLILCQRLTKWRDALSASLVDPFTTLADPSNLSIGNAKSTDWIRRTRIDLESKTTSFSTYS